MDGGDIMVLRLYVAGHAPNSSRALTNARALCVHYLANRHHLEIVDVLDDPQQALRDGVLVTPTLVRLQPQPVVRIIGDLSETARILDSLGIYER